MEARKRSSNLILLDPQAGPDGLLVAVKDPLDAASTSYMEKNKTKLAYIREVI